MLVMRNLVILLLAMVVSLSSCKKGNDGGAESKNSPITFADAAFLAALIEQGADTNGDGKVSYAEAEEVAVLNLEDMYDVASLQGIEYFKNLVELNCTGTRVVELNLSSNELLTDLDCTYCKYLMCVTYNSARQADLAEWYYDAPQVQLVDVNPSRVVTFSDEKFGAVVAQIVGKSQVTMSDVLKIKRLDVSGNSDFDSMEDVIYFRSLKHLVCRNTRITSLDVRSLPRLESLDCGASLLEDINLGTNTSLKSLTCDYTSLESLDVSCCTMLDYLKCDNSSSLEYIYIRNDQSITTIVKDATTSVSLKRT